MPAALVNRTAWTAARPVVPPPDSDLHAIRFSSMLTYILIGLAVLFVAFLLAAVRRPDDLCVERSITIAVSAPLAFSRINDLRKWQEMSPYVKNDPAATYTFAGPAAGVGSSLEWAATPKSVPAA